MQRKHICRASKCPPETSHLIIRSLFLVSPDGSAIFLRLRARVAIPLLITVALQV